jgi:Mga helix-turn-helix domain.
MEELHYTEFLKMSILNYLNAHEGKWVKTNRIAEKLNLGLPNTRNIILSLKQELADKEVGICFTISKNKGIFFTKPSTLNLQSIISELYSSTLIYDLIDRFFYQNMQSLTSYGLDHYISVSSLRRKILAIKEALKVRNIDLKKNQISGDEFAVRSFLYQYYWGIHKDSKWPFQLVDKNKILSTIFLLEKKMGFCLTEIQREQFCYFWAISKIRRERDHYLLQPVTECRLFADRNRLYSDFKVECYDLLIHNEFLDQELQYLFYGFFCSHINFSSVSPAKLRDTYSILRNQANEANKIVKLLIEKLTFHTYLHTIEIDTDILGMELLATCQTAFLFYKKVFSTDSYDYTENLRKKYPYLYQEINHILTTIIEDTTEQFNYEHIFEYTALILHDSGAVSKYGKKIRVAVMSSEGALNEEFLRNTVKQHFEQSYTLEFVSDGQKYDILLTDIGSLCVKKNNAFYLKSHRLELKDLLSLDKHFSRIN